MSEDKIIIGVENDGDLAERADSTDQIKHTLTVTAAFECSLRGQLISEPIGKRIGKGHAELKDIDARLDDGAASFHRAVEIGIARTEVADEGGTVFFPGTGKGFFDSIHQEVRISYCGSALFR